MLVTTVLDLTLAHYGVARQGLPGEWPAGYDDPAALHAGLAGADHRRRRPAGGAGRARVRAQRRGHRGALDDRDGRRHQPLVPLRPDLPDVPGAGDALRLRGRERRRLGALRRPGEGPAAGGLADDRLRARLGAPAAPPVGHPVLLPGHRPVALRALPARRPGLAARPRAPGGHVTSSTSTRSAPASAGCPHTRASTARRSTWPTRRERAGHRAGRLRRPRAARGAAALRLRGPRRAREPPEGADGLAGEPAGLLRQGPRVLPQAPARHHRERGARRGDPAGAAAARGALARPGARGQARPAHHARLPHDLQTRCSPTSCCRPPPGTRSTTSPPPTCIPSCTPSTRPIPPPWEAKKRLGHVRADRAALLRAGRAPSRCATRPDRRAAAARHAGRDRPADGRGARLARRRVRADPGQDDAEADRGRARLSARRRALASTRAAGRGARHRRSRAPAGSPTRRSRSCAPRTARSAAASADGRPSLERVEQACEAILALSGTMQRPARRRGLPVARAHAPACHWPTSRARAQATASRSPTRRCSRGR